MGKLKSIGIFLFLSCVGFCCADNRHVSDPGTKNDSVSAIKPRRVLSEKLEYSKVVLFSIDSSIYFSDDTTYYFPDGKQAYSFFLGGSSFVDSTGRPIHKRYNKYPLTKSQDSVLQKNFLYELCDGLSHACLTTYRDVLVFYDASGKVVQQVQICFGCGDSAIFPYREFMCQEESDLDFKVLKGFVETVKRTKF